MDSHIRQRKLQLELPLLHQQRLIQQQQQQQHQQQINQQYQGGQNATESLGRTGTSNSEHLSMLKASSGLQNYDMGKDQEFAYLLEQPLPQTTFSMPPIQHALHAYPHIPSTTLSSFDPAATGTDSLRSLIQPQTTFNHMNQLIFAPQQFPSLQHSQGINSIWPQGIPEGTFWNPIAVPNTNYASQRIEAESAYPPRIDGLPPMPSSSNSDTFMFGLSNLVTPMGQQTQDRAGQVPLPSQLHDVMQLQPDYRFDVVSSTLANSLPNAANQHNNLPPTPPQLTIPMQRTYHDPPQLHFSGIQFPTPSPTFPTTLPAVTPSIQHSNSSHQMFRLSSLGTGNQPPNAHGSPANSIPSQPSITNSVPRRPQPQLFLPSNNTPLKPTSKDTRELNAICITCQRPLSRLFLFGTTTEFVEGFAIDIQCLTCHGDALSKKRKTERFGRDHDVTCRLCAISVGHGGVRGLMEEERRGGEGNGEVWKKPEFGVEVVCTSCFETFRFCTKCGGGGQWRTGRWRPKEMFEMGRKTCILPHLRLGDVAKFKFVVYRLPVYNPSSEPVTSLDPFIHDSENMDAIPYAHLPFPDAINRMADDVADFWDTASVTTIADAQTMKGLSYASTWEDLVATKAMFKEQFKMLIKGGFHPSYDPEEYKGKRFRRYLTLGFCPAEKGKDDPALCGQRIVASISHIWDLDERQITVRFSCTVGQFGFHPNSLLPKVNYAAGEGILGNMEKLGKLVAELGTSIPEFTWGVGVWGKGVERARKSILTGMLARGTQLIEGYCKEKGIEEVELRKRLKDYLMEEKEIAKRDVVIMTMETMATFLRW